VAARLQAIGRQVIILESHRAGQIGKSYLVNDKLDAAKIARIYLSGLSIHVWAPDSETRQRRELLSTYLGLNPSVVQSGEFEGSGELHQHGRGALRALLIQASKRLLTTNNPLQKWGLSVALRRGTSKAAVAVARKLTVAVWHILQGHWNKALDENTTLLTKLAKLATELGVATLRELGYTSKIAFQQQKLEVLRTFP